MKKLLLLVFVSALLLSCARVGSPVGGAKDTLAPMVIGSNIDSARVNVDRNIRELRIDFNEYITLKNIGKNLNISPAIKYKRVLPSGIANTSLLIQWEDTLQANTTYNFNFGNAIIDNNEGNPLRYYNFAFSTGPKLDDLYISGEVSSPLSLKKINSSENKMVVGLYKLKDTINYKEKPYYIAKVDDDGYYELNYLAPGKYKIIAFDDENENSVYNAGKETIAFTKDTLTVDKSISGYGLKLFPSRKPFKKPEIKEMPGGVMMLFEGNPDEVKVTSATSKLNDIKVTHQFKSDTVKVWFDAVKADLGQTNNEKIELGFQTKSKSDTITTLYKYNKKNTMTVENDNGGDKLPPNTDFKLISNYIIDKIDAEKWTLTIDSTTAQPFAAKISDTNPYQIIIKSNFEAGKKYQLTIPKTTISSYFEKNAESKRFDFEVDQLENYGYLKMVLKSAPANKYWLQLLDSSGTIKYQKYTQGSETIFDILKPGEYIVRILVDNNEDRVWDEADFESQTFAEDAFIYYKTVVIRPLWKTNEDWDLQDKRALDLTKLKNTAPAKGPKADDKDKTMTPSGITNPSNSGRTSGLRDLQLRK